LKIQPLAPKHWVAGICQMRENGIQLLFFQAPDMSDACTQAGHWEEQLSVDMLAT
jgi:hypothetical protein